MTRARVLVMAVAVGLSTVLAACGGSDDESGAASGGASGGSAVTIEGFAFKPATITVAAGTEVTWSNKDTVAHNVKPDGGAFETSPNILGDNVFRHTYGETGSFPYVCGIHNYMTGTVVVT